MLEETGQVGQWLWKNREWVIARVKEIREWLLSSRSAPDQPASSLLIIGPGGVGKSTAAKILAGDYDPLLDMPGEYDESLGIENYSLVDDPTIELVVPPGQKHRRDSTWHGIESALSAGEYHGIILVCSYGYHSLGEISYRHHRLYTGDDTEFLRAYLNESREEEIRVLRRLSPHIKANDRKYWLVTLVTKQDLWWPDNQEVERHYREGPYRDEVREIAEYKGRHNFRHELILGSLVIRNFVTEVGEKLAETVAGYDQQYRVSSVRRLWESLDALRHWEAGP